MMIMMTTMMMMVNDDDHDHHDHLGNRVEKLLNGCNFSDGQAGVKVARMEEINLPIWNRRGFPLVKRQPVGQLLVGIATKGGKA